MKRILFLLLLISSYTVNAQTLKDLLYSGKLKSDSGTVVKKDDDLSAKIDTSQRKPPVAEIKKPKTVDSDAALKVSTALANADEIPAADKKDNNILWNEFIDGMTETLKAEVLTSKKVKKGDYLILVDYEIGLDGQVTIKNVFPSPENDFLQIEIKERLSIAAPKLNPVIGSNGKARKLNRRYSLKLSK